MCHTPFGNPKAILARIDANTVALMPLDTLHRIMAVSLNASKSMEMDMAVGLQFTNTHTNNTDDHTLQVRKGILEVDPPSSNDAQFVIATDVLTWKQLVLGQLAPEAAIASGKAVISGGTLKASMRSWPCLMAACPRRSLSTCR